MTPTRAGAILAVAVLAAAPAAAAPPAKATIVVCAPGYPGTTAEAQSAMDAFSTAVAKGAGPGAGPVAAVYHESEEAGVARLRAADAAIAIATLPFYLKHERDLGLRARLDAVPTDRGRTEQWTLVAKKGRVTGPASLDGFTLSSISGYAPAFVRGALLGWGRLPASVRVVQSSAVLSTLRRAVAGEPVAALLDGAQAAALPSLPFAAELEVVARSEPFPTAVVATVGTRLAPARWKALASALERLQSDPGGAAALEGIRMKDFTHLDDEALAAAKKSFAAAHPPQ